MPTVRGTRFPVGTFYGDPSEGLPPRRPEPRPTPMLVVRREKSSPTLVIERRTNKASRRKKTARRAVFVVTDYPAQENIPNRKPDESERRRFLRKLGVA